MLTALPGMCHGQGAAWSNGSTGVNDGGLERALGLELPSAASEEVVVESIVEFDVVVSGQKVEKAAHVNGRVLGLSR